MCEVTVTPLAVIPDSAMRATAQPAERRTRTLPRVAVLAAMCTPVLLPANIATAQPIQGYFQLQTEFLEGESRCLEGNRLSPDSTLGGAAFMDLCRGVDGQLWQLVPDRGGYFRLQTKLLEGENKCLEGNRPGGATLRGATYMNTCKDEPGQLWEIVSLSNGLVQLRTKFLADHCLEGNAPGGIRLGGAAFMDRCKDGAAGQHWRLLPQCAAKPQNGWPKCRSIASPEIKIYGTGKVSDAAMDMVRLIYTDMTSRFTAQHPRTPFDNYEVYITNGEDRSVLATLEPLPTMWGRDPDDLDRADELRGGTSDRFLWISEQMICRRGVATRNQRYEKRRRDARDDITRTYDQVIHEFGHAIDMKFGLGDEIKTRFGDSPQRGEMWAWAVEQWFGAGMGSGDIGTRFGESAKALVASVFNSARTFSCEQYWQWNPMPSDEGAGMPGTIARDNTVRLKGRAIRSVVYVPDSAHVTEGQRWEAPPDIHGRVGDWSVTFRAGRQSSRDVAGSLKSAIGNQGHTYSPASQADTAPAELNFYFGVFLTLEISGETVHTFVYLGQGKNPQRRNNWWIGGDAVANENNKNPVLEIWVGGSVRRFELFGGVSTIALTPLG